MLRNASLAFLVFYLSACVSTYQPSRAFLYHQKTLSRSDAMKIFHSSFGHGKSLVRICHLPYETDPGVEPVPSRRGFQVVTYRIGDLVDKRVKPLAYKKTHFIVEWDVSRVKQIRIGKRLDVESNTDACAADFGGYYITSTAANHRYMSVQIRDDYVDKYLAALAVLAPRARIVQGPGL